jgi:hypothetical protein
MRKVKNKAYLSHGKIDEVHTSTANLDPHREESHLGELFVGLEECIESSAGRAKSSAHNAC